MKFQSRIPLLLSARYFSFQEGSGLSNNTINPGVQQRRFALLLHAGYGEGSDKKTTETLYKGFGAFTEPS
jgi:hypothetical protein